jgi:nucleoside-diphosphate-sugar epimerase
VLGRAAAAKGDLISDLKIDRDCCDDMKILITGNMGYVGPAVLRQLRQSYPQATLIGLDTGYFAHCLTNADVLPELKADIQYFADVRFLPTGILHGIDCIVHLAAISNDAMGNMFEQVTHDINFQASIDLAREAKSARVKSFIFASSCSIYGLADDAPRHEASPLNPLTAYAKSKVQAETELQTLADKTFVVTCPRFATACGMSPRLRLDLVVNDFVACAVACKNITILSDGTPWRPLIHVRDIARVISWAIGRDPAYGEFLAVNAGSNVWNYQVKQLAEAVAKAIPEITISINENAPSDSRSYRVDFGLYETLAPMHQPQVDLFAAIHELKEGLDAMEFNDPKFRSSIYIRLEVLKRLRQEGLIDSNMAWTGA